MVPRYFIVVRWEIYVTERQALGFRVNELARARLVHKAPRASIEYHHQIHHIPYVHYASLAALLRAADDLIHIVPVPFQSCIQNRGQIWPSQTWLD
jgi:hypothetical protein